MTAKEEILKIAEAIVHDYRAGEDPVNLAHRVCRVAPSVSAAAFLSIKVASFMTDVDEVIFRCELFTMLD